MMTSINPKNTNISNVYQSDANNVQNNINNIFQRNNYGIEQNMNKIPQSNMYNNLSNRQNQELGGENIMNNMNINNYNLNIKNNTNLPNKNMNFNAQNNSINLKMGLQNKKNYSTPILNEIPNIPNQEREKDDYNKSMDLYERNIPNKNMMNLGQNQIQGNNEFYKAEIERLKQEINDLRNKNEYLNSQLKEEQIKNEQLFSIQKAKDDNENSILSQICHCLHISSFDEILPKLNEVIDYLNNNVNTNVQKNKNNEGNNKIRDELISKLQNLYLSLTGSNEKKEEITIKILWRWIKHLINTVKQLALEKEQNIENYQMMQEFDEYKEYCEYCEELISRLNLQNLDELKSFMDNLLKQINNENQPEMRRMPNKQNMAEQQYQGQEQNYQPEEENEEVEIEGEEGIDEEGADNEGDGEGDNENMEQNQQQYENENENEYEENNEMMEEKMQMNEQNYQNDDNYNFNKYEGN